jgi:hypothetical protein
MSVRSIVAMSEGNSAMSVRSRTGMAGTKGAGFTFFLNGGVDVRGLIG